MSDVLVTVPKDLWEDWIAEGDLPGDRWRGDYWSYYLSGGVPDLQFTGRVWCAEAFRPSVSDRGPGGNAPLQELVWGHLAGADRRWKLTSPDQRCYVVAHSRLRGYADLFAIEINRHGSLKALIRRGDAVAVTIAEPIRGFRGWRYRWWDRAAEQPFADWKRP